MPDTQMLITQTNKYAHTMDTIRETIGGDEDHSVTALPSTEVTVYTHTSTRSTHNTASGVTRDL